MKRRRCLGLALALSVTIGGLGAPSRAAEARSGAEPRSVLQRASGSFSTTIAAGKYMKIGSALSLGAGERVNFDASYFPKDASVDFGLLDSGNVYYYFNSTTGSVDGDVTVPKNGSYTPAIRNNSSTSINVYGTIEDL